MNRIWSFMVLVACLAIGACHPQEHAEEEHGTFPVTSPLRQDTELTNDYVAQVRAIQHIELRALEHGYLQETFVDEGQQLEAGELMFQIMPLIYQAEVSRAKAEVDLVRIEYDNAQLLADKDVIAPSELALARAKLDVKSVKARFYPSLSIEAGAPDPPRRARGGDGADRDPQGSDAGGRGHLPRARRRLARAVSDAVEHGSCSHSAMMTYNPTAPPRTAAAIQTPSSKAVRPAIELASASGPASIAGMSFEPGNRICASPTGRLTQPMRTTSCEYIPDVRARWKLDPNATIPRAIANKPCLRAPRKNPVFPTGQR